MSPSFRKATLVLSLWILSTLACKMFTPEYEAQILKEATQTAEALKAAPGSPLNPSPQPASQDTQPAPLFPEECFWQFVDTTEALATGGGSPGMSAQREGSSITTSYTHDGNFGCSEQTFITNHHWTDPALKLFPGDQTTFSVSLSWELVGTAECTSLTAGAVTYVTAGDTTFKADVSTINVSSEPEGLVYSDSGSWTVSSGAVGDTMRIQAHGSSGSLGGTITYNYKYVCGTP
jgi:hypothetical protein